MGRVGEIPIESPLRLKDENSKEFHATLKEEEDWRWSPPKYGYRELDSPINIHGQVEETEEPQQHHVPQSPQE